MSEKELSSLLAKLKEDVGLQEKLKGAADFDAAVEIAKQAGFDITVSDWLQFETSQFTLSDEELETVAGGCQASYDTAPPVPVVKPGSQGQRICNVTDGTTPQGC